MRNFFAAVVATFCGVGYIPLASGTWASAVAVSAAWYLDGSSLIYWAAGLSAAGFWACAPARELFHSEDPRQFVMDEVCGMLLTLAWMPKSVPVYLGAFMLFRLLDIWKPWLIRKIQNYNHPWSVMWDDLAAGLAGNVILQIIVRVFLNR